MLIVATCSSSIVWSGRDELDGEVVDLFGMPAALA